MQKPDVIFFHSIALSANNTSWKNIYICQNTTNTLQVNFLFDSWIYEEVLILNNILFPIMIPIFIYSIFIF